MQKLIEGGVARVTPKGRTVDESAPSIKRERGLKGRSPSRLQAEPAHPPALRSADDVLQQLRGDSLTKEMRMSAHRFHLSASIAQLLQRADARDPRTDPAAPNRDIRRLKTGEIQGE